CVLYALPTRRSSDLGSLGIPEGRVHPGVLGQASQQGRLGQREVADGLAEVVLGRGLHAVDARAQVDFVQVRFEDLRLAVLSLDLDGPERLLQLAGEGALVGEKRVLGQLLGDGAAALQEAVVAEKPADVGHHGPEDGPQVDAEVLVEAGIFNRDDGVPQVAGDLFQAHRDPVFPVQPGDDPAVHVVDVGGLLLVKDDLVQGGGAAQVAGHHAGGAAHEHGYDEDRYQDADAQGWACHKKPPSWRPHQWLPVAWRPSTGR